MPLAELEGINDIGGNESGKYAIEWINCNPSTLKPQFMLTDVIVSVDGICMEEVLVDNSRPGNVPKLHVPMLVSVSYMVFFWRVLHAS